MPCPTVTELNRRIEEVRFRRHVQRLERRLAYLWTDSHMRELFRNEIAQLQTELSRLQA